MNERDQQGKFQIACASQTGVTSMRRPRTDAFTLIELLVVISIITLLISILLPALRAARDAGYRIRCMANMRQQGIAAMTYAEDNNRDLPKWRTAAGSPSVITGYWYGYLASYAGINIDMGVNQANITVYMKPSIFACPSDPYVFKNTHPCSYGWNANLITDGYVDKFNNSEWSRSPVPSSLLLIADQGTAFSGNGVINVWLRFGWRQDGIYNQHQTDAGLLFTDGHVISRNTVPTSEGLGLDGQNLPFYFYGNDIVWTPNTTVPHVQRFP